MKINTTYEFLGQKKLLQCMKLKCDTQCEIQNSVAEDWSVSTDAPFNLVLQLHPN